jgi:aminoglycoside phosphotransferase (APT) family kinase protein
MDEAAGQTWAALSTALDPDRMHSVLTGALGRREVRGDDAFVAMPPADARLGARVLKHKHGRRCVIRYALSGREDGEAGDAVGKVYRDEARAERMYRRVQGLRRRLPDPEARCIPAPLGYLRELGLVLQEWRPGRDLRHALAEPTAQQACVRSAHWLAALHAAAPLEGLKHRTLDYELTRIEKFRSAIRARAGAEVPAGLAAACHGLQAAAARLGPYAPCMIHKDFYYAHVLCDGCEVSILDFDEISVGDPAFDVGHFRAHLARHAGRCPGDAETAQRLAQAFLAAYPGSGDAGFEARVLFYEAYTFLKLAATEARRSQEGWVVRAGWLTDRAAERALRLSGPGS